MLKGFRSKQEGLLGFSDFKQKKFRFLYVTFMIILVIAVAITLFPIFWLFVTSLKSPTEIRALPTNYKFFPSSFAIGKYGSTFTQIGFQANFINSTVVIVGAVIASVLFNGIMGYGLAVLKPKGHKILFGLIMGCMLIPATTAMIPLFTNIKGAMNVIDSIFKTFGFKTPGWLNFASLWLIAGANPFFVLLFKTYFESIPESLFEAARIDGVSRVGMFFRIVLPLSKPIIMVIIIFTINATWSDFLLPYLVLPNEYHTVMVKVFYVQSQMSVYGIQTDQLLSILLTSMIPPIILFFIFSKQITSSVATSGLKG